MDNSLKLSALLNAKELVEMNKKLDEYTITNKFNKLDGDSEVNLDETEIFNSFEKLQNFLQLERVLFSHKRSRGIYEDDKNRIKVTSLLGKIHSFGFMDDHQMYLSPHEALLLMEMNRLEVTYNGIIMSIEQAYAIFLNQRNEIGMEEYVVYSYLTRLGYNVNVHDPVIDHQKYTLAEKRKKINNEDEMIWNVLFEKLNLPFSQDFVKNEQDIYLKTKSDFHKNFTAISGSHEDEINGDNSQLTSENKMSDEPPLKKLKSSSSCSDEHHKQDSNFLDILKTELEYLTHKQIFQKFSYVFRKDFNESSSIDDNKKLKFNFDVFIQSSHFKRTEQLANYRLIILRSTGDFPSNRQLALLRTQQSYDVPIILAFVTELSVHYSICVF